MYSNKFYWTEASINRNKITCRDEPLQPILLLELMKNCKCDIFFDIGANIGFYALLASTLQSIKNIYAFEANEATFHELKTNIELNNLEKIITAIPLAVSRHSGIVKFLYHSELSGINCVSDTSFHDINLYSEQHVIKATSIDDYTHINDHICGLKVDVEGHEIEVINGSVNFLQSNKCILQIEIYDKNLHTAISILNDIGYKKLYNIKHDFCFSNFDIEYPINTLFQNSVSAYIDLLNGKFFNGTRQELLDVKYQHINKKTIIKCNLTGNVFINPEFCIYVYIDNKKVNTIPYSAQAKCSFDRINGRSASVTVFVREKKNIHKKIKKSISIL